MARIVNTVLADKVMSAEEAARFINPGDNVGMSGFTGSGYPKAVPTALANRIEAAHDAGEDLSLIHIDAADDAPRV